MSKFKYTETEKQMNTVLKHQDEALKGIQFPSQAETDTIPCVQNLQKNGTMKRIQIFPRQT